MRPFFYLFVLSVLLFTFHGAKGRDRVHEVCTAVVEDDKELKYDFGKLTLQGLPEVEMRTDLFRMGVGILRLVYDNFWDTRQDIMGRLADDNLDVYNRNILSKCLEYYGTAAKFADEVIRSYNERRFSKTNVKVTDALTKGTACEDVFEDRRLLSPLQQRYEDLRKFSELAVDVIAMVDDY